MNPDNRQTEDDLEQALDMPRRLLKEAESICCAMAPHLPPKTPDELSNRAEAIVYIARFLRKSVLGW